MNFIAAMGLALLASAPVALAAQDLGSPVVWECSSGVVVVETSAQPDERATRRGCTKASAAAEQAALRAVKAWQPAIDRTPAAVPDVPCPIPTLVQPNCAFKPTAGDALLPSWLPRPAAA